MQIDFQIVRYIPVWHCECFKGIKDGNRPLILPGGSMRSNLVFGATKQVAGGAISNWHGSRH
jgi:hypothetical protein